MKKLLTILLGLLLMVSLFGLVACGDETTEEKPHTHTYETTWTSDATHHYKKANCEHTTEISEKAEHIFGDDEKCDVCEYEKPHTHTYETTWTSDATHHYKKANCEHTTEISEKAEHVFGDDEKCDVCEYEILHTYTVTKEVWEQKAKITARDNFVSITDIPNLKTSSSFSLDGNKAKMLVTMETFDMNSIVEYTNNSIAMYNYSQKDGKYYEPETMPMPEIKSKEDFINEIVVQGEVDSLYFDDLFESFSYDETTKSYKATFDKLNRLYGGKDVLNEENPCFKNIEVSIKFVDNEIKGINLTGNFVVSYKWAGDNLTVQYENIVWNVEFGNTEIEIPTETISKPTK